MQWRIMPTSQRWKEIISVHHNVGDICSYLSPACSSGQKKQTWRNFAIYTLHHIELAVLAARMVTCWIGAKSEWKTWRKNTVLTDRIVDDGVIKKGPERVKSCMFIIIVVVIIIIAVFLSHCSETTLQQVSDSLFFMHPLIWHWKFVN
jgi:hypothetical protein